MHPVRELMKPSIIKKHQNKTGFFSFSDFITADDKEHLGQSYSSPPIFYVFAMLGTLGVLGCIMASIFFAPQSDPMFHFNEDGAITAVSTVSLAMASALAAIVFYLKLKNWSFGTLFWLILATGCLFLSLDEQLMFHERGGQALETTRVGTPEFFRNWNDLIVIGYGIVALVISKLFWREIIKCRTFAILFAMGFGFYAIHTGIDSIVPSSISWKDVPEESAKLLSVFALFLAVAAQLLAMLEKLSSQGYGIGTVRSG